MKRTLSILAGVLLSASLVGCSSTEEATAMQQLTNKVDTLSQQVSEMQGQQDKIVNAVNDTRAATDAAYQEAMRANKRIDNIAGSYTK